MISSRSNSLRANLHRLLLILRCLIILLLVHKLSDLLLMACRPIVATFQSQKRTRLFGSHATITQLNLIHLLSRGRFEFANVRARLPVG